MSTSTLVAPLAFGLPGSFGVGFFVVGGGVVVTVGIETGAVVGGAVTGAAVVVVTSVVGTLVGGAVTGVTVVVGARVVVGATVVGTFGRTMAPSSACANVWLATAPKTEALARIATANLACRTRDGVGEVRIGRS